MKDVGVSFVCICMQLIVPIRLQLYLTLYDVYKILNDTKYIFLKLPF